ncbi:MAG: MFS transporter [Chitinophagales bacterium]|jgi:MFS transporter, UMF1 family|nr:MFS transporter [Chitinophagales bacterium]
MNQSTKKVQRAWAMYDWANSAYNLVITSTIFPAYYVAVTSVKEDGIVVNDKVNFFGATFSNTALFDYALAAAYLVIAIISPILSSIADYRGNKKRFMQLFCYLGSAACCGLYFFKGSTVELGIILFAIAALGYCGSIVFYNAFLPEIAVEKERDRVSAMGFAYGYIGSVLLQLVCFVFVLSPETFGIQDDTFAPRLSFLLVGIWWLVFGILSMRKLPDGNPMEEHNEVSILTNGFHELQKVWQQVKKLPVLKTYLGAFFMYSMGVQTVMLAATIFGSKELKLATGQLIGTILIIQLVAIAGAFLMSKLSEKIGNLKVLLIVVLIWIGVCIAAYYTTTATQFYIIATVVGLVMGGIQSLSRSTYSKLMPETKDTTSFFSFYDVTEKLAIVAGMFSFGFIEEATGSMRNSILALITFFTLGAIILFVALRTAKKQHLQSTVI